MATCPRARQLCGLAFREAISGQKLTGLRKRRCNTSAMGTEPDPGPGWVTGVGVPRRRGKPTLDRRFAVIRDHADFDSFQRQTVKRFSSSIKSGSVPLWERIPGMILLRTPIPRASTYP